METKKLGRASDQRQAMLRGLVTDLLWYGKIETTLDRAQATSKLADKYITLAINTYQDIVTEEKVTKNFTPGIPTRSLTTVVTNQVWITRRALIRKATSLPLIFRAIWQTKHAL